MQVPRHHPVFSLQSHCQDISFCSDSDSQTYTRPHCLTRENHGNIVPPGRREQTYLLSWQPGQTSHRRVILFLHTSSMKRLISSTNAELYHETMPCLHLIWTFGLFTPENLAKGNQCACCSSETKQETNDRNSSQTQSIHDAPGIYSIYSHFRFPSLHLVKMEQMILFVRTSASNCVCRNQTILHA